MSSLQGLGFIKFAKWCWFVGPRQFCATAGPGRCTYRVSGQDFFIEGEVSNPNPYQGEQVMYTFRFYQAANLYDQPTFEPPHFPFLE